MARRVPSFEDANTVRRYPWFEWTDGSIWEIMRDEDYDVATENMRVNLHERAKHQHQQVRTTIVRTPDGGEGLRFQFTGQAVLPLPPVPVDQAVPRLPKLSPRMAASRYPTGDPRRLRRP